MGKRRKIPKCRYCKRSLPYTFPEGMRNKDVCLNKAGRPQRGRMGLSLFCSLACIEEATRKRYTGKSVPRGESHEAAVKNHNQGETND